MFFPKLFFSPGLRRVDFDSGFKYLSVGLYHGSLQHCETRNSRRISPSLTVAVAAAAEFCQLNFNYYYFPRRITLRIIVAAVPSTPVSILFTAKRYVYRAQYETPTYKPRTSPKPRKILTNLSAALRLLLCLAH